MLYFGSSGARLCSAAILHLLFFVYAISCHGTCCLCVSPEEEEALVRHIITLGPGAHELDEVKQLLDVLVEGGYDGLAGRLQCKMSGLLEGFATVIERMVRNVERESGSEGEPEDKKIGVLGLLKEVKLRPMLWRNELLILLMGN